MGLAAVTAAADPALAGLWRQLGETPAAGWQFLVRPEPDSEERWPPDGLLFISLAGTNTASMEYRAVWHRGWWALYIRPDETYPWIQLARYHIDRDRLTLDLFEARPVVMRREK